MPEEGKLQSLILKDLRSLGKYCECFKIMKTSDAGEPDIFFTTAETGAILIEAKSRKGKAAEIQKNKIDKLNRCGTRTFLCNSWSRWKLLKIARHGSLC